ncbi:MAG: class I mannose-6-phosphate isomerase [Bacillota bacterium]|jgi:mannose-6-phosphate isomerase|nr:class I mannose-6-phosphate isomerase [Bacillota bacterium]HHU43482.1 mannose-6-phosphate isomerase [Clostridiales bacterium]
MNFYPFLLNYNTKDYIWGGTDLQRDWNKQSRSPIIAESWELSLKPSAQSYIINGKLKGYLREALDKYPEIVGKRGMDYCGFPLLIKFINAHTALSIQVHPDDEYALINERQFGKSEMWYICDAKDDASIYLGLNQDTNREELKTAIERGEIERYLNLVKVKKGDCYFVPCGTLHAIRGGVTILEVQQSSDVTYRVYDYDRVDNKGNKRKLHIDKALDVINYNKYTVPVPNSERQEFKGYKKRELVSCDYFKTCEYCIDDALSLYNEESFICFTVIEGEGQVEDISIKKGNTIFLPAGCEGNIKGKMTIITSEV